MPAGGLHPMTLAEVQKGMRVRILALAESDDMRRLKEMGLTVGTEFEVVKVAPFGDPVEIALRGYRLCLRKRESDGISVEIAK